MRRRNFIVLAGASAVAWPFAVGAQGAGRTYRVGVLTFQLREAPHFVALFDELRKFGFVENENLIVHGRGFGIKSDQIAQIATELVNAKVDVIMCGGDLLIHAAQKATDTIPILAITDDMVATGLIRSPFQSRRQHNRREHFRDRTRRQAAGNPDRAIAQCTPNGGAREFAHNCAPTVGGASKCSTSARRRTFDASGHDLGRDCSCS